MKIKVNRVSLYFAARPLLAVLAIASSNASRADEPNPYYIGVSQAFSHDSNVNRIRDSQGDNYWSTGLLAGIDQPFGRQRFYASGNVRYNKFQKLTELNNTSYGLNAALDWSTIERLSGTLSAALNENLANYSTLVNDKQSTQKNIQRDAQLYGVARWGMVSLLTLEGTYLHRQLNYSSVDYRYYNVQQDTVSLGLKYRPSALLTLGAAIRTTHGDYPDRLVTGSQSFNRYDLDLTTTWFATGQSTINGRLSFGRQKYSGGTQDALSITSGSVNWAYKPTGKLSFNTSVSRDTGLESTVYGDSVNQIAVGDNSRLTTSLGIDAVYLATAKIRVNASLRYSHRSLSQGISSTVVPSSLADATDNIRFVSLGASYAPTRNWLIACNVGRESRSTSDAAPAFLTYPYSANTASCSAQFTLQ